MLVPRFVVYVPAATEDVTTNVNEVVLTFVTTQVPFNLTCSVPTAPEIFIDIPVETVTAPE